MMALKKIVDEPEILTEKIKYVYASFGLTAGFCLLFAIMPGVFFPDFVSVQETQALQQLPQEYIISNHEQSDGYPQGHLHIRLLAFVLDHPHRFGTS